MNTLQKSLLLIVAAVSLGGRAAGQALHDAPATSDRPAATAEEFKAQIESLMDQNRPLATREAERLADEAMKLYPKEDFFFRTKTYVCGNRNDHIAALKPAEIAYELNPSPKNACNLLATIIDVARIANPNPLSPPHPFAQRYYEKGLECAEPLIQSAEWRRNGYLARGILHYVFKEYQAAVADYDRLIALDAETRFTVLKTDPNNPFSLRGLAYAASGQHEKAIKDFTIAINEYDKQGAYNHRAFSYSCLEKWTEAKQDYEALLHTDPDNHPARWALAMCCDSLGEHARAIAEARCVAHDLPQDPMSYYFLGVAYLHAGEKQLAKNSFERLVQLSPDETEITQDAKLVVLSIEAPEHFKKEYMPSMEKVAIGIGINPDGISGLRKSQNTAP